MRRLISLIALLLAIAPAAAAQEAAGAFLFAYRPHRGSQTAFVEGYRAHLEWHRVQRDSLTWYGWDVLAGPGIGTFVDGVFGIPFAALDVRVDPAGDAADLEANVTPHADAVSRALLRLRSDLSIATPLEDRAPTRLVQVTRLVAAPGDVAGLERALLALREGAASGQLLPYTVYESVAGEPPGFMLMVWRERLGAFDQPAADPVRALLRSPGEPGAGPPIAAVTNEVWVYRPDLTYMSTRGTR